MINSETFLSTYSGFDNEIIVDIIDTFLSEYSERIEIIKTAWDQKDMETIHQVSHKFKGSIGAFYAYEEVFIANKLMEASKDKNEEGVAEWYPKFMEALPVFRDEIIRLRAEYE